MIFSMASMARMTSNWSSRKINLNNSSKSCWFTMSETTELLFPMDRKSPPDNKFTKSFTDFKLLMCLIIFFKYPGVLSCYLFL